MPAPVRKNTVSRESAPPAVAPSPTGRPTDSYRSRLDHGHTSASALAMQIATTSAPKPEKRDSWLRRHLGRGKRSTISESQAKMNELEEQRKVLARFVEIYSQAADNAHDEAKRCMAHGDREGAALALLREKDNNLAVQSNRFYLHQTQQIETELARQEALGNMRNLQAASLERIDALRVDNGSINEHSDRVQGSLETLQAETAGLASNVKSAMNAEAESLALLELELAQEHGARVQLPSLDTQPVVNHDRRLPAQPNALLPAQMAIN